MMKVPDDLIRPIVLWKIVERKMLDLAIPAKYFIHHVLGVTRQERVRVWLKFNIVVTDIHLLSTAWMVCHTAYLSMMLTLNFSVSPFCLQK